MTVIFYKLMQRSPYFLAPSRSQAACTLSTTPSSPPPPKEVQASVCRLRRRSPPCKNTSWPWQLKRRSDLAVMLIGGGRALVGASRLTGRRGPRFPPFRFPPLPPLTLDEGDGPGRQVPET